jgi:hypothetical protein
MHDDEWLGAARPKQELQNRIPKVSIKPWSDDQDASKALSSIPVDAK